MSVDELVDETPARAPGIRQGQRVLAVGMTGEGKSEAIAHLFAVHSGQRLLIDVNGDYELGPAAREDASIAERLRDVDWRRRTIHYIPRFGSLREYDELHRAIFMQGRILVWNDEAEDVAPVHRTPRWVKKTVKQGRKQGITYTSATQRPAGVERAIINQSEHAFIFRMVDPDDIQTLSVRMGVTARELADKLLDLPEHGFLYHIRGERQIRVMPPLAPGILEATRRHVVIPR